MVRGSPAATGYRPTRQTRGLYKGGVIQKYGGNCILAFVAMAFVAFVSAMEGWGCWSENRKLEKHFREN
jgi:hypothetical protein